MKRLLIVHPGTFGATARLVAAVRDGAQEADEPVEVRVRSAPVCDVVEVLEADGYVFASPERFGSMAGELKLFFDRTFYPLMADHDPASGGGQISRIAGRPYALVVTAGNDGSGAVTAIERILKGWRLRAVAPPLIARRVGGSAGTTLGSLQAEDLARARNLGEALAVSLSLGIF